MMITNISEVTLTVPTSYYCTPCIPCIYISEGDNSGVSGPPRPYSANLFLIIE